MDGYMEEYFFKTHFNNENFPKGIEMLFQQNLDEQILVGLDEL